MLVSILFLAACSKPEVDVTFRLPADGVVVVAQTVDSSTRTPLGPENLEINSTKRIEVLEGGRLGTDRLHWREQYVRYRVEWLTRQGTITWEMQLVPPDEDEEEAQPDDDTLRSRPEEIPEVIARFGPHAPREVWVGTDRTVQDRSLDWPEPPPEEGEQEPAEAPPPAEGTDVEPEPAPKREVLASDLDNWLGGLVHGPGQPVQPGHTWSWTVSQQVTRGGQVSTEATWEFERLAGGEAVLIEHLSLNSAMPPASGQFRTSDLSGSGEMRVDTSTGLPTRYHSSWEAALASPSARGSSTVEVDTRFRRKQ